MTASASAEPAQTFVRLEAPFTDQKPGTSGLRKSSRQFEQPHYLESFVEAVFRTLPGVQGGTLVLGGDGRYGNLRAINVILRMGAAHGLSKVIITTGGKGIKIEPNNHKAIFQLGNILLMEKNYLGAIKLFDKSIKIKPDFWQAINNQGLAYFEKNKVNLAIKLFESAISIEENAEPLLGLASCINIQDNKLAIQLAKKALEKDPKYVNYDYRKEQLWGEKLQASTEILLQNEQLKKDVILAKSKISESS